MVGRSKWWDSTWFSIEVDDGAERRGFRGSGRRRWRPLRMERVARQQSGSHQVRGAAGRALEPRKRPAEHAGAWWDSARGTSKDDTNGSSVENQTDGTNLANLGTCR